MQVERVVLVLAALGAGCAQGDSTGERQAQYLCANGEQIEMRFLPSRGLGVLVRDGKQIELQQQAVGSGFSYSYGPNTVRGKGEELIVEVGRMVPLKCELQRRARGY